MPIDKKFVSYSIQVTCEIANEVGMKCDYNLSRILKKFAYEPPQPAFRFL